MCREPRGTPAELVAIDFASALVNREYLQAHHMTSEEFQANCSWEDMQHHFEAIVPTDWGSVDPLQIGLVMDNWPNKHPSDVEWIYIVLGGECYSEAITVVVANDQGALKVRSIEWGRP